MADEFKRSVDKSQIPVCTILGVEIAAVNMGWLIDFLHKNVYELKGDYLCVSNVHTTVLAFENDTYRSIQNNGIMALPDGGPLSNVGRKRGYDKMARVTGPDLMGEIFSDTEKSYRHYFYGSTQETLDKLRERLLKRYPEMHIVGMYSPPFRPLSTEEEDMIVDQINSVNPDFVWVGLGAPKQEKWMASHQGKISGLMIGVGAGFDYYAGNIKRAPGWMQQFNLEWLYRLWQDPKRLLKRYLHSNLRFIWYVLIKGK